MCGNKRDHRTMILIVFYYLNLVILLYIPGCKPSPASSNSLSQPKSPLTVNVIRPVRTERAIKTATYFGKLVPNQRLTLGFPVGGKLTSIAKTRQTVLDKGVIAELEASDLIDQRDILQTRIGQLKSQLGETADTEALENQLAELDRQIDQRKIVAPFECMIQKTFAANNSLVGPNAPVITVVDTSNPIIEINLPRRISNYILPDDVYVFLLGQQLIRGQLKEKALNERPPGSISVWFDIQSDMNNVDFAFDQSIEGKFSFQTNISGYWLPIGALRKSSNGLWSVFVVEGTGERGVVQQKLIEIDLVRDDIALVTTDLTDNLVVFDGIHRIVSGQEVTVNFVKVQESESTE